MTATRVAPMSRNDRRGRRSTRSYVVEFGLVVIAIVAIYLFLMNGGPHAFGEWWAGMLGAP